MKSRVSYAAALREQAINRQKGLFTIDLINASKKPGKLGSRMTMQGPVGAEEYKAISSFIVKLLKLRNALAKKKR